MFVSEQHLTKWLNLDSIIWSSKLKPIYTKTHFPVCHYNCSKFKFKSLQGLPWARPSRPFQLHFLLCSWFSEVNLPTYTFYLANLVSWNLFNLSSPSLRSWLTPSLFDRTIIISYWPSWPLSLTLFYKSFICIYAFKGTHMFLTSSEVQFECFYSSLLPVKNWMLPRTLVANFTIILKLYILLSNQRHRPAWSSLDVQLPYFQFVSVVISV